MAVRKFLVMTSGIQRRFYLRMVNQNRALLGLVAILLAFGAANPAFLTLDNLSNLLLQSSSLAVVAIGMTFVILAGHIDLSVGSVLALSGVTCGLFVAAGVPVVVSVALGCAAGGLCGLGNGLLVAFGRVPSFVATLGLMSIARGVALALTDGRSVSAFPAGFAAVSQRTILGVPVFGIVVLVLYTVAFSFRRYSVFGVQITATGSNEKTAWLCGVPVRARLLLVFSLSGITAGLGGIILASRLNSAHPLAGNLYELDAIAAVIIGGASLNGGKASIAGTFTGVLLLTAMRNGLSILDVSSYLQQVCVGVIIIAAVVLDAIAPNARHNSSTCP